MTQDELWWAEPPLKERLQRDPVAVLKEQGINVPPGIPLAVVHEVVRIVSLVWLDGKLVPRDRFHIDPADEGLLFGRGVWESTRTFGGVPWLWPLHLDRMRRTAALLELDVGLERLPDRKAITDHVRQLTTMDVVVRLYATAGSATRRGIVWMTTALPPTPGGTIRLQTCRSPVVKGQPFLAWKTFQYASRMQAGTLARRAGFDSALMLDPDDNVLEAAHANIFVRLKDGWATPTAETGLLLPGTVRQHLLANPPVPLREQTVTLAQLREVREAFLTNSNVGIVPVTQIDNQTLPVGGETLALLRWLLPAPPG